MPNSAAIVRPNTNTAIGAGGTSGHVFRFGSSPSAAGRRGVTGGQEIPGGGAEERRGEGGFVS